MKKSNIKAILFDSGKVLNAPATGHWFITPNFFEFVDKDKFEKADKKKIANAFREANKYISGQNLIATKEEEYKHFVEFYNIFSANLPELEMEQEQIEAVAKDLVYNPSKYVFYEDALQVVPRLSEKYKLAIVSDAWPSLLDVYADKGMDKYFDCFVISSILGVTKPHEKMYLTAIEKLGVATNEAVFVDDNLKNCMGAKKLGIYPVLLCRNKWVCMWNKFRSIGKGYAVIDSLEELKNVL